MKNNWEIIDDQGTIYSGTEDEMRNIFEEIMESGLFDGEKIKWHGDLKLIEIHSITR